MTIKQIFEKYNGSVKFTDHEIKLLRTCILYTGNKLYGLPGHDLIVLIYKLLDIIGEYTFLNVKRVQTKEGK